MTTETVEVEQAAVAKPPVKRPPTSDHKAKAKKVKKPKVKVETVELKPAVVETDDEGAETIVSPAEYGRRVTLHGVTVTVPDTALGDFQTTDDLSILGEAQELGEDAGEELLAQALSRISPLLRRLVGFNGSQEVLTALRRENAGVLHFGHAMAFIGDLIDAMSPNS
jgi:hypothetical protein